MTYMIPEYVVQDWWEIDGSEGRFWYPAEFFSEEEVLKNYVGDVYEGPTRVRGVGARLSAPGYLDSMDWIVVDTLEEAKAVIEEYYDLDPET